MNLGPLVRIHDLLWNHVGIWCLICMGSVLSAGCGFPQLHFFRPVLRQLFRRQEKKSDSITPFQALCTALGGSVGTGNLVGVAGAICLGGPGSLFWMWICSFFAMAVKFSEALLCRCYRVKDGGQILSGPMYVLTLGMNKQWLGRLYAVLGIAAALGMGSAAQITSLLSGIHTVELGFGISVGRFDLLWGVGFCCICLFVLGGETERTASVMGYFVPAAAGLYIISCLEILAFRCNRLGFAVASIIRGAFSPAAVTGGAVSSLFAVMGVGCCKGMFSNEAGLGTAAMIYGKVDAANPVEQSMLAIAEVAVDTLVICTLTGLVILTSQTPVPYGQNFGTALLLASFSESFGVIGCILLAVLLGCFSLSTVLTWGCYGYRFVQFLFGKDSTCIFSAAQVLVILFGAAVSEASVWLIAETINGLLMLPNLFSLLSLRGDLFRMTKDTGGGAAKGGTYANFNQCQSL